MGRGLLVLILALAAWAIVAALGKLVAQWLGFLP